MSDIKGINLIFGIIFCLIQTFAAQTADYCSSSLCSVPPHIACNNTGAFASTCLPNAAIIPMTDALRVAIVNKHNALRNQVATGQLAGFQPAIRMATMTWNSELAKLAELNVKQCEMKHDKCRNTATIRFAGQNLAWSQWSGTTNAAQTIALQQVQSWFDEYKLATMADIDSLPNTDRFYDIGHFTAMVQEKSIRVGCAIMRQTNTATTAITQIMACNYAYTNIFGNAVYRKGVTASACTTGKNVNFAGLCSTNEAYTFNKSAY